MHQSVYLLVREVVLKFSLVNGCCWILCEVMAFYVRVFSLYK